MQKAPGSQRDLEWFRMPSSAGLGETGETGGSLSGGSPSEDESRARWLEGAVECSLRKSAVSGALREALTETLGEVLRRHEQSVDRVLAELAWSAASQAAELAVTKVRKAPAPGASGPRPETSPPAKPSSAAPSPPASSHWARLPEPPPEECAEMPGVPLREAARASASGAGLDVDLSGEGGWAPDAEPPRGQLADAKTDVARRPTLGEGDSGVARRRPLKVSSLNSPALRNQGTKGVKEKMRQLEEAEGPTSFFRQGTQPSLAAPGEEGMPMPSRLHRAARRLVRQKCFEVVVSMLIVSNSLYIGLMEDWRIRHLDATPPRLFSIIGVTWTVLFLIELLLRLTAERKMFFLRDNKNFHWNMFDLIIVVSSVGDEIFSLAIGASIDVKALRVLRILRMVRAVRIFRVLKVFSDLRVMVSGIMRSAKPLLWALVLLLLIIFIFAVMLAPFVCEEIALARKGTTSMSEDDLEILTASFSSMPTVIFTMFKAISGGQDWGDLADPLTRIHPGFGCFYSVYVAFATFCVLNIITGVFVDAAHRSSMKDEENMMAEEISRRKRFYDEVKKLFDKVPNPEGEIDIDEFMTWVEDVKIQACFRKLGLDVDPENAQVVFNLLDMDEQGTIDFDKFALGVQQINGPARSLDIARVRHEIRKVRRFLRDAEGPSGHEDRSEGRIASCSTSRD